MRVIDIWRELEYIRIKETKKMLKRGERIEYIKRRLLMMDSSPKTKRLNTKAESADPFQIPSDISVQYLHLEGFDSSEGNLKTQTLFSFNFKILYFQLIFYTHWKKKKKKLHNRAKISKFKYDFVNVFKGPNLYCIFFFHL